MGYREAHPVGGNLQQIDSIVDSMLSRLTLDEKM